MSKSRATYDVIKFVLKHLAMLRFDIPLVLLLRLLGLLDGLGLGNREGYTVLSPDLFSTPAPSVNGNGSMYNSSYNMSHTTPIFTSNYSF